MKVKFFVQHLNADLADKEVTKVLIDMGVKLRVQHSIGNPLNVLDTSDMDYEVHTLEDLLELLDKIDAPVLIDTVGDHIQVVINNWRRR